MFQVLETYYHIGLVTPRGLAKVVVIVLYAHVHESCARALLLPAILVPFIPQ